MISFDLNKISALALLACLWSYQEAAAQKKLSVRDTTAMGSAARNTLGNLKDAMIFLADPTNNENDRQVAVAGYLEQPNNIFLNKKVFVDDDTDPDNSTPGGSQKEALDYLSEFNRFYHTDKSNPIEFTIKSQSPVLMSSTKMPYMRIHYSQQFKEKSNMGKTYNKVYRVAELYFEKNGDGDNWRAYIGLVKFEDRNSPPDDLGSAIPIVTNGTNPEPVTVVKDDAYYESLLVRGNHSLADNKFPEAYRYLQEASESSKLRGTAGSQLTSLKSKVKSTLTMDVDTFFHNSLKRKGGDLNNNGRYEEAKKYYTYAKEWDYSDKSIPPILEALDARIALERSLDDLFKNGVYEQAITGYTDAIKNDPGNSDLYVGRAKCYWKLYKNYEARGDFNTAAKRDENNADIYLWQGRFFESMNDRRYFDSAYASLMKYINKADYRDDPALIPVYTEAVFCKAMALYNAGTYRAAIDSFNSAIKLRPSFTEAVCYLGCCYYELKDHEKALEYLEEAKKLNEKYPDAHYWYGKTLRQKDWIKYSQEAIREMKLAIDLLSTNTKSSNWLSWNSELADILQRNKNYDDAVKYYTNYINADNKRHPIFFMYRGECYFQLGQTENAGKDYYQYKNICETNGDKPNPGLEKDLAQLNGTSK